MIADSPNISGSASGDAGRLSLVQDVMSVLLSRGELSKSEIMELWDLDHERYEELKPRILQGRLVVPGPKGKGGFQARFAKRAATTKEEAQGCEIFEAAWQNNTVDRLRELLAHKELEDLLGDLVYTVRRARIHMEGVDRRGTKSELAAALVIQHDIDLFRDAQIRKMIAKKCKVAFPKRWHPGKDTAIRFSEDVGFPSELAGIPSEDAQPDFEYLEGRLELKPLADFQREVQQSVIDVLGKANGKAIVTLPTGAGKTRVAVDSIRDWLTEHWEENPTGVGNTVLWLAHTEELCEQAYSCFRDVWQASTAVCPLLLFRFWGKYTQDLVQHRETLQNMLSRPTLLISTPHRIVNLLGDKVAGGSQLIEDIRKTAGLILIDEAHRAAAPTYKSILTEFTGDTNVTVLGLTATPFRHEYAAQDPEAGARQLQQLFEQIIEPIRTLGEDPRLALQQKGYLAKPVWESVETNTLLKAPHVEDASNLTLEDIGKIDNALKIRADNPTRRMAILDHILPTCRSTDTQILYFGPTVLDAECMAFLLRQRGVSASFVSGETRDVTRRRVVKDFKDQKIKVLCNCEVLTTGFDAPKVTHVVMGRPTVSQVLYEQMLGRGLRGPRFGGTETCVIIDCEDNYRSDRPRLGYQLFRDVWGKRTKSRT